MGEDVFGALIEELDLTRAGTGEYYGEVDGHPAVLTVLSVYPPGVIFKIRINSEEKHDIEFSERFLELIESERINVSIENGYGWFTFYDLNAFEEGEVLNLLGDLIEIIEDNGLGLEEGCAVCNSSESLEIYYFESKINRLCPDCLKEKQEQQRIKDKKLIELNRSSILWSLLGVAGSAVGWMGIWLLYDYMFELQGTDEIQVFDYEIALGVVVAILILVLPVGLPLRRLRIKNGVLAGVISSIAVFMSFVLGEILLAMVTIAREFKIFSLTASIDFCIYCWRVETSIYNLIKIVLVIVSTIVVYFIAKNKKAALEI